ncbi:MAG: hypothetical protein KC482_03705 [Dehalococcoidia bacterium]|nr:hypothetical protein [Dehalococcoidia bacterium]
MARAMFLLAAAMVGLSVLLPGGAKIAFANGVPQLVKLEYLPGVSNWGPEDAEGLLEFSFAEGYAIVDVKRIPATEGTTFEGWMRTEAGDAVHIGDIVTDATGIGHLEAKLTGLSRFDYTQFLVAARTDNDAAGAIPAQISIAGNFSVIGDEPGDGDDGEQRPQVLPDTGELPGGSGPGRGFMAMIAMAATGLTIVMVAQYRKRRRA